MAYYLVYEVNRLVFAPYLSHFDIVMYLSPLMCYWISNCFLLLAALPNKVVCDTAMVLSQKRKGEQREIAVV
jgi:hypothetical protein